VDSRGTAVETSGSAAMQKIPERKPVHKNASVCPSKCSGTWMMILMRALYQSLRMKVRTKTTARYDLGTRDSGCKKQSTCNM
jgi:hypothetical protein